MLWVVLGTAGLVAAFVVVGVMVDRRAPMLPATTDGAGARPDELPEPPPRPRVTPGESAAAAVKVPANWRDKLAAGSCTCGQPLAIASDEGIRFDGRVLVVVRLACASCGHTRSVYLEPAAT